MATPKIPQKTQEKLLDVVKGLIESGAYEGTGNVFKDYEPFMASVMKSRHPASLSDYSKEDYASKNARLYKLGGYDAGYALSGDGDIITVHNNSDVRGVAPYLVRDAISRGGNHLDHFDIDRLNKVYGGEGLLPYGRLHWDDRFAPKNWDYEADGRPDVRLRGTPEYIMEHCTDPYNYQDCNALSELPEDLYLGIMEQRRRNDRNRRKRR